VKEQWHSSGIAGKRIETIEKLRKGFSQMKIPFLVATPKPYQQNPNMITF